MPNEIHLEHFPALVAKQGYIFQFDQLPLTLKSTCLEDEVNRLERLGASLEREHGTGFYAPHDRSRWNEGLTVDPKYSVGEISYVMIDQNPEIGTFFADGHTHIEAVVDEGETIQLSHIPPSEWDWAKLLNDDYGYHAYFKMIATPEVNYVLVKSAQTPIYDYEAIFEYYKFIREGNHNPAEECGQKFDSLPYPYLPAGMTKDQFQDSLIGRIDNPLEDDPEIHRYFAFCDGLSQFVYGKPLRVPRLFGIWPGLHLADVAKVGLYKSNKDGNYERITKPKFDREWQAVDSGLREYLLEYGIDLPKGQGITPTFGVKDEGFPLWDKIQNPKGPAKSS